MKECCKGWWNYDNYGSPKFKIPHNKLSSTVPAVPAVPIRLSCGKKRRLSDGTPVRLSWAPDVPDWYRCDCIDASGYTGRIRQAYQCLRLAPFARVGYEVPNLLFWDILSCRALEKHRWRQNLALLLLVHQFNYFVANELSPNHLCIAKVLHLCSQTWPVCPSRNGVGCLSMAPLAPRSLPLGFYMWTVVIIWCAVLVVLCGTGRVGSLGYLCIWLVRYTL